jgi:hypothetical protein
MAGGRLPQDGETVVPRPLPPTPAAVRQTRTPARQQRVRAVAGLVPWDWLAALPLALDPQDVCGAGTGHPL